jgi:Tfp pilus assembly protein PilW
MRPLLREESGFTLVELIVVTVLTVVVVGGLSNLFVSGLRAGNDANARLTSQSSVRLAFDRLEYETRCASTATLLSSGGGVTLVLPSSCAHATGTFTWCVTSGALIRYAGSSCSGTSQTFVTSVTTPTPFSCVTATGQYPRLQVALTVNPTSRSYDRYSATDLIDMRNAPDTGSTDCS